MFLGLQIFNKIQNKNKTALNLSCIPQNFEGFKLIKLLIIYSKHSSFCVNF